MTLDVPRLRRGFFLDRDGVVNVDSHFPFRRQDFVFQDGIFPLIRMAISLNWTPIIVTNQSGIARGLFLESDYQSLTEWMLARFEEENAPIARVYHCPFLPDAVVEAFRHPDHPWRKPRPGMLLQAAADFGLDLENSVMLGDRWTDAAAAAAAGIGRIALLGEQGPNRDPPVAGLAVERLADLDVARAWLVRQTPSADRATSE